MRYDMKHSSHICTLIVMVACLYTPVTAQKLTADLAELKPEFYMPYDLTSQSSDLAEFLIHKPNDSSDYEYYQGNPDNLAFPKFAKNNAKKGLLYGTLGGAALGGIIGAATYKPCAGICIMHPDSRAEAFLYGSLAGALLGGLTGSIIGTFIPAEYGMKAELRPVFYKQDASGLSTVYQGAALRISF
jgi:hypothetical protein